MPLLLLLVAVIGNLLSIGSACNPAASIRREIYFDENVSIVQQMLLLLLLLLFLLLLLLVLSLVLLLSLVASELFLVVSEL